MQKFITNIAIKQQFFCDLDNIYKTLLKRACLWYNLVLIYSAFDSKLNVLLTLK